MEDYGVYQIYYDFEAFYINWNLFRYIQITSMTFFFLDLYLYWFLFTMFSLCIDLEKPMIDFHAP